MLIARTAGGVDSTQLVGVSARLSSSVEVTSACNCVGKDLGRDYVKNFEGMVVRMSRRMPTCLSDSRPRDLVGAASGVSRSMFKIDSERGPRRHCHVKVKAWRVEIRIHAHPFLANCVQCCHVTSHVSNPRRSYCSSQSLAQHTSAIGHTLRRFRSHCRLCQIRT